MNEALTDSRPPVSVTSGGEGLSRRKRLVTRPAALAPVSSAGDDPDDGYRTSSVISAELRVNRLAPAARQERGVLGDRSRDSVRESMANTTLSASRSDVGPKPCRRGQRHERPPAGPAE